MASWINQTLIIFSKMAKNRQNPRNFTPQDRIITEIDRLLAITASKPRSFPRRQSDSYRSGHLRASYSNASAALGVHRGLRLAARSPAAQKSAQASEQSALTSQAVFDQQLVASGLTGGLSAGPGYAGGLVLGLSSRFFGDEAGRKLQGSINQLAVTAQNRRAQQLKESDPVLSQTLLSQAASQRCACGPHGHRTRSRVATRVLSRSASMLERLSRL